jgi:hypothetical protein
MTPKEKASELISKFMSKVVSKYVAKECALIAIKERIDEGYEWMGGGNSEWEKDRYKYWQEVKQEIEAL